METKTSIVDVIFAVVISILWVSLGIVWISSLNPAGSLYLSCVFVGVFLFFLPVVLVAMIAAMEWNDNRKK